MVLHTGIALHAALLACTLAFTAAGFISKNAVLEHRHDSTGRNLLQAKKDCPVDLNGANYTVVTSRCKNLLYQRSLCCNALRELASPYAKYINDPSSSCASIMFSYLTIYGKYQPGLFFSTCCDDLKDVQEMEASFGAAGVSAPVVAVVLTTGVVAALLLMSW